MANGPKVLFSLESIMPKKGIELIQEYYFLVLGFDSSGTKEAPIDTANPLFGQLAPEHSNLANWFLAFNTPIFKLRKKREHEFPGGMPLYYGTPGELASVYFAAIESNRDARDLGKSIADTTKSLKDSSAFGPLMEVIGARSQPTAEVLRAVFPLVVKLVEIALLNRRDSIEYTNVFTFKPSDQYLAGLHKDWGNQRVDFAFSSEVSTPGSPT